MKHLLTYTFLFVAVFSSCGQNPPAAHIDNVNYNIEDTVTAYGPNNMVRNVKYDSKGNILFAASWGGAFRYDGKSFTKLTSKIGSRRNWDVLEDRRGNLWFATTDSGVYQYNGKSFQHFTTREGLPGNQVFSVYEDKAGNMWFGGDGLSRYDGKSFQVFTAKDGFPGGRAILEDKTGKLWIATGEGPCVYDGKTFTVLKNNDGKTFKNVWSIIEDKKGNIWFGDVNGLWRYDGATFFNVSKRGAYAILQDKNGNICTTGAINPAADQVWALSRYEAKSLYDKKPLVTEIVTGGTMDFLGMLEGKDGSIWFGTGGGLHRFDGKTLTDFRTTEEQQMRPHHLVK